MRDGTLDDDSDMAHLLLIAAEVVVVSTTVLGLASKRRIFSRLAETHR